MKQQNKSGNIRYDREKVLETIAEYFAEQMKKKELSLPVQELYENIQEYAERKNIPMPTFLQARKYIIEELTDYGDYTKGERFTSETAYRLRNHYFSEKYEIKRIIQMHYENSKLYKGPFLVCAIRLPDTELIDQLAKGIGEYNEKSEAWARFNTINKLCKKIKKRNSDLIYAVIPEFNHAIYLNSKGRITPKAKEMLPICNSLLMFVKNCPEGAELIESLRNSKNE